MPLLYFEAQTVISLCGRVVRDPALLVTFVGADQVVPEHGKTTEAANLNRGRVRSLVAPYIPSRKRDEIGLFRSHTDFEYRAHISQKSNIILCRTTSKIS